MKMDNVHFIREMLVTDKNGRKVPTIQISYSKPFDVNPKFRDVAKREQKQAREIYKQMGGGRLKNWWVGLTIIIPNKPGV